MRFAQIDLDQGVDGRRHTVGRERRTEHLAHRGVLGPRTAEGELIEFLALLIDAQNADVAHMVVTAGVNAAGDLDLQLADGFGAVLVAEGLGDVLSDGDRPGVGQGAVIEPRTGDDVRNQVHVRRGQTRRRQGGVDRRQVVELYVRQDDVLLVRDADVVLTIALCQIGQQRPSDSTRRRPESSPTAFSDTSTMP